MTTRTHLTFEGTIKELVNGLIEFMNDELECSTTIKMLDELFSEIEQSKSYD